MSTNNAELAQAIQTIRAFINNRPKNPSDSDYSTEELNTFYNEIIGIGPIAYDAVAKMQRDEKLMILMTGLGERGIKYLEYAAKIESDNTNAHDETNGFYAMEYLGKIGKPSLPILEDIFETSTNIDKRITAARDIAGIDGGYQILKNIIANSDEQSRFCAVEGILRYLYHRYINSSPTPRFSFFLPPGLEQYLDLVRPSLDGESALIRSKTVYYLSLIEQISIEEISKKVEDPDERTREMSLHALFKFELNEKTAHIYVLFCEDQSKSISDGAIEQLSKYTGASINSLAVAKAIIEELIIRKTNRDPHFFNPEVTASAFFPLFNIDTRVANYVYSSLCSLAINGAQSISDRAISVGYKLDPEYFLQIIRLSVDEAPEKVAQILYALGSSVNLPSITNSLSEYTKNLKNLEDESIQRWKEITQQSKVNYWTRMGATVLFFLVALGVIIVGIGLVTGSTDPIMKGIGAGISSLTTIGGMWTKFWKASIEDIKSSHIQQAGLEAAFISFMTQIGQIRLVFSKEYETNEISIEMLRDYQNLASCSLEQLTSTLLRIKGQDV